MSRLTQRTVDKLSPRDTEYLKWDVELSGFGVRVYPSGSKSYVVQYRKGRLTRRMTIGGVKKITAPMARAHAQKLLAEAVLGGDPAAERASVRNSPTVAELAERYFADEAATVLKPRSIVEYNKTMRNYVSPALGTKRVSEVTRVQVENLRNRLRDKPFAANRALSMISSLMRYAIRLDLRPEGSNPAVGIERLKEPSRERFLSESEFERLGAALRAVEQDHPEWSHAIAAIRLLSLTGARKNEILHLAWSEVDFDRRELRKVDSKTGPKTIPCSDPTMAILQGLYLKRQSEDWVIPSMRNDDKPLDWITGAWNEVRKRAGLKDVRLHDLRHSLASMGTRSGLNLQTIGGILGQSQISTTQRYSHLDSGEVRNASQVVGLRIDEVMNGREPAVVLPMEDNQP